VKRSFDGIAHYPISHGYRLAYTKMCDGLHGPF
jgi:hypothetical protein